MIGHEGQEGAAGQVAEPPLPEVALKTAPVARPELIFPTSSVQSKPPLMSTPHGRARGDRRKQYLTEKNYRARGETYDFLPKEIETRPKRNSVQ